MTSFWVPSSILRTALPGLVKYFKGKQVVPPVLNYPPVSLNIFIHSTTQTKPTLQILASQSQLPAYDAAGVSFGLVST